jgi:hypothetical protein
MNEAHSTYYGQGAAIDADTLAVKGERTDTATVSRAMVPVIEAGRGSVRNSIRTVWDDAEANGLIPYAVHVHGGSIPPYRLCIVHSVILARDAAREGWIDEAPDYWESGEPLGCTSCGEWYGREADRASCRCNVEGGRS